MKVINHEMETAFLGQCSKGESLKKTFNSRYLRKQVEHKNVQGGKTTIKIFLAAAPYCGFYCSLKYNINIILSRYFS